MRRELCTMLMCLVGAGLLPGISMADWILIESQEDHDGVSVRELNDQVESRGSQRLFTVRSSYRSKDASAKQGQFFLDYVADCNQGVIRNIKAVAILNGQQMEGPPSSDPIVMPSKPFAKIYPYVCNQK